MSNERQRMLNKRRWCGSAFGCVLSVAELLRLQLRLQLCYSCVCDCGMAVDCGCMLYAAVKAAAAAAAKNFATSNLVYTIR